MSSFLDPTYFSPNFLRIVATPIRRSAAADGRLHEHPKNKLDPFFCQVRMVNLGFMAVFMTEQLNQHERLLFSKGSLS